MDKLITSSKTDKLGIARISLPGNKEYNLVFKSKKKEKQETVYLKLNKDGEAVVNLGVSL